MDKPELPALIRELLNQEGHEMEIQPPDEELVEEHVAEKVFDPEILQPHLNFDCISSSNEVNSGKTPFAEMSATYEDLHPLGWLKKKIIRVGDGKKIPNFSVVYYHYNSYLEMCETPFDSSFLRNGKPLRIQIGVGAAYEGMEHALLSMSKGEKANFLVDPILAFGKFGVPPRIPGNATILNVVEVHEVIDCGAALKTEDRESNEFKAVFDRATALANLAKDHFAHGLLPAAIKHYKNGLEECDNVESENQEQRVEMHKLRLRLFINIMVCYNHRKFSRPKEVISTAKEAIHLIPSYCNQNSKFFFNLGKAHFRLNDYTKASQNFKKSLSIEPLNPATLAIMKELEIKASANKDKESAMWSKGLDIHQEEDLNSVEPSSTKKSILFPIYTEKEMHDKEEDIYRLLCGFKADDNCSSYSLPGSFLRYELELFKRAAERLGLVYEEVKEGIKTSFRITRPPHKSD